MGGGASKPDPLVVDMRHFSKERCLGAGGFGKVYAVTKKTAPDKDKMYAIKELSKTTILGRKSVNEVFCELKMLTELDYPLICNAWWAFQDERNVYLLLDLALGGDLRFRMGQIKKTLPSGAGKQLMAVSELRYDGFAVLLALAYLHRKGIIFRDLKPDNVLLQEGGYVLLTDFGISRSCAPGSSICVSVVCFSSRAGGRAVWQSMGRREGGGAGKGARSELRSARLIPLDTDTQDRSGTHGYMAPECYRKDGQHSFSSDLFGFGVLLFELAMGSRPFLAEFIKEPPNDPEEVARAAVVAGKKLSAAGYPEELAELVGRCLQFDPAKRPTCAEALAHPFWQGYTEADFTEKKAPTFFKPRTDVANCDSAHLDAEDVFADPSAKPKPSPEDQDKFKDYYFDRSKAKAPPAGGA